MTRALIVADPQRDFCEGGSLGVAGGAATVSRIDRLLTSDHGYAHVIATRDHHIDPGSHFASEPDFVDSWPPHCVVGTPGSDFHDELTFRDFSAVFYKGQYAPAYSAFQGVTADGEDTVSLAAGAKSRSSRRLRDRHRLLRTCHCIGRRA